ncbi:hypothetical protein [Amycolatopsis sp. cmx-4-61]|uniref:hypothetical protein n=1 Tax=Amycolatopsis sp. cmx-4-61 TaxID=2790937 RepID=UPI00397BD2FF
MPKSNRSSSRTDRARTLVTFGGAAVVSLGSAACVCAWLNGESLTVAVLTFGAAMAALLNALVAVATFLAGHPRDDVVPDRPRGRGKGAERGPKKRR